MQATPPQPTERSLRDAARLPAPRSRVWTTLRIIRDPYSYYAALRARYGDPMRLRTLNGDVVMTGQPELIRQIFAHDPDAYAPFATQSLVPLLGARSLLTSQGEVHKRDRKLLRPPFHGSRMRAYAETIARLAREHLAPLEDGAPFVALDVMGAISRDVIIEAVFGATGEERARFAEAIEALVEAAPAWLFFTPLLQRSFLGLGPWSRFVRARARFIALCDEAIAQRRAATGGEDILSLLISARDEDGEGMGDEALRAHLITLLVAGHETTAVGMGWALYRLHRAPEALRDLRAALDALGDVSPEEVAREPLLEATCKETLRLYPIVTDALRLLKSPMTLGDVQVEAGWGLAAAIPLVHHDPERYEEPLRFNPARFLERRTRPWEYLPFGGGHRRCIGASFAMFEMAIVLHEALSRYTFELLDRDEVRPGRRNVTLGPSTGVRMRMLGPRRRPPRPVSAGG